MHLRLLSMLIALPLAGAAILLLGGKATNAWGHLLACAAVIGSSQSSIDPHGRHRKSIVPVRMSWRFGVSPRPLMTSPFSLSAVCFSASPPPACT